MKKVLFLLATLAALVFTSCNNAADYELIDQADSCKVEKNKSVTIFRNGEAKRYALTSTEDCFLTSAAYPVQLKDTAEIYIYRTDDKIVASTINSQEAMALRDYIGKKEAVLEYGLGRAIFLAVFGFVFGIILYFQYKKGMGVIVLLFPALMIVLMTMDIKKPEFVTDGYLCEKPNGHYGGESYWIDCTTVMADDVDAEDISYTILLPNNIDIRDGQEIKPAEQIFVYRYKDDYFITKTKFADKTLNSSESLPSIWWKLALISYVSVALGFTFIYFLKKEK